MPSCLKDFQVVESLGKGSFGTVVKCIRRSDKQIYAMKQIKLAKLKEKDKRNALNQVRFLASIQNPNIVSYKEAFYDQNTQMLCIIMEFANDGDLNMKIKNKIKEKQRFSQKKIWKMAYQALKGLQSLHQNNIIHRDIKSANIFFHQGNVKLGDLNVAKLLKDQFANTQTGTPYYASPQIWNDQPYSYKSDVWSLGCAMYEMAMLKHPFEADNLDDLYRKVALGNYQKIAECYTRQLQQFIGKCLTIDQNARYSVKELLDFGKIKQIRDQLEQNQIQSEKTILLDTIDFPKNFKQLNLKLPRANYQKNSEITRKVQTSNFFQFDKDKKVRQAIISSSKLIASQSKIPQGHIKVRQKTGSQKIFEKQYKQGKQEKKRGRVIKVLIRKHNQKTRQ